MALKTVSDDDKGVMQGLTLRATFSLALWILVCLKGS